MSSIQGPMNLSSEDANDSLFDDILELLENPDCDSPEVILLIGRSGAGKSAMINTIHKVLTGKYFPIAKPGSGVSATVTMELNRYVNCGVSRNTVTNQRLKAVVPKLPNIFDCAGLKDENSESLSELLELLIGGYIYPKTSIPALQNIQESHGVGSLRQLFTKPDPSLKVSKIVFMQGCIDAIPRNLIECLRGVLNIVDDQYCQRKYQCDVFVVISKYDLVKDSKDSEDLNLHGRPEEKSVTSTDLEKVEKTLEEEFNFAGNREFSRILWVSLGDNVGFDNRYIENAALKFLKRMIEPGVPKEENKTPVVDTRKTLQLRMFRLGNQIRGFVNRDIHISLPKLLVALAIMVAVLAFFYSLLNLTPPKTPDSEHAKVNSST